METTVTYFYEGESDLIDYSYGMSGKKIATPLLGKSFRILKPIEESLNINGELVKQTIFPGIYKYTSFGSEHFHAVIVRIA